MMIIEDTYTVYHKIAVYVKVSLIASRGHPATSPATHGPAIEDIVAQDRLLVGGCDQLFDGLSPAMKESREPGLPSFTKVAVLLAVAPL